MTINLFSGERKVFVTESLSKIILLTTRVFSAAYSSSIIADAILLFYY